tara:strand:- start:134 stop:349 length:216 start_codon:yes stop_codon:yes gene_type:complete
VKVGDLVKRKVSLGTTYPLLGDTKESVGVGIIVGKHIAGDPAHKCIDVFYPKVGKTWSIAERLVEVISESR